MATLLPPLRHAAITTLIIFTTLIDIFFAFCCLRRHWLALAAAATDYAIAAAYDFRMLMPLILRHYAIAIIIAIIDITLTSQFRRH